MVRRHLLQTGVGTIDVTTGCFEAGLARAFVGGFGSSASRETVDGTGSEVDATLHWSGFALEGTFVERSPSCGGLARDGGGDSTPTVGAGLVAEGSMGEDGRVCEGWG